MPDSLVRSAFNYASLDTGTAQFLNQQASAIKVLVKQSIENIIEVGKRLNDVKALLVHGQWMDWLEAEFGWTERTALNYMRVAQEFKIENISNLQIATSALYVLTQPSTPNEAREEAIARAQAGERITVSSARDLRDKYIPPKPDLLPEIITPVLEPQIEPQGQGVQAAPQVPPLPITGTNYLPREEPRIAPVPPTKRRRAREERSLSVVPKRVQPGEWWKLGQDNYLYCGDPTSAEFQKLLPSKISLSLAFPSTVHWKLDFLSSEVLSSFALHTVYEADQDLSLLREAVKRFLEVYTEGGDTVVVSFLADTAILALVDELGCLFFCADPDSKRCDAALTVWTTTGRSAEKMKTRQTGKKRLVSPALTR